MGEQLLSHQDAVQWAHKGQTGHRLPTTRTSLVGRERDVAQTRELVLDRRRRLLTLTGLGGVGKTRLALEVVAGLQGDFPDGVWPIELASISDPLLVPKVIAHRFGITETRVGDIVEALVATLRTRSALLLLDNCEHLIEACAHLANTLLSDCPDLRILATSREPLRIAGEQQRPVYPLAVPHPGEIASPDELARCPAVQLFVDRAAAMRPEFQLAPENCAALADICTLLEGIPLALELAAARVRALSVEQIRDRLDANLRLLTNQSRSAPARHQSLNATLRWSYCTLSARERIAFRRMSVFLGGFSVEAAHAVCDGDGLDAAEVLEALTDLVDKSLVLVEVHAGAARYRLFRLVRVYGQELLTGAGELDETNARLAAYCTAFAERAEPELHGRAQTEWLNRLDLELDNIRAAVSWATARGEAATATRLAGALSWYCWMRGHLREGQRWLTTALALGGVTAERVRSKALCGLAMISGLLGEFESAMAYASEALRLYQEVGDAAGTAVATLMLAQTSLLLGDLPSARSYAEQSIAISSSPRASGLTCHPHAHIILGQVAYRCGEAALAAELHKKGLALFRERGDSWAVNYASAALASLDRADNIQAAALCSVRFYWQHGDYLSLASALEYLAKRGTRGPDWQVKLFATASSLRQSVHALPAAAEREDVERCLSLAEADLGRERFGRLWADACALSFEDAVVSVLDESRSRSGTRPPRFRSSIATAQPDALTAREREVAGLIARGYSDRQIAAKLVIGEGTARVHVHHILEKLGFSTRVQVAVWALAQN